jgi:DNA-binding protein YbaB
VATLLKGEFALSEQVLGLTDAFLKSVIAKVKRELKEQRIEGSSGDGAVKVVMSGWFEVIQVLLKDDAVLSDRVRLQEMVKEATNVALQNTRLLLKKELEKVLGQKSWLEEIL